MEERLSRGETVVYQLSVPSDQYVRLTIEERGVAVDAVLLASDGEVVARSMSFTKGIGSISAVNKTSGLYRLEVRSPAKAEAAGYRLTWEVMRTATEQDRSRVAAERRFIDAEALRLKGTTKSRDQALEKYEDALKLWRLANEPRGEALTLNNAGKVCDEMGEKQAALDKFEDALALWQSVNDREGEATTQNNIGTLHSSLGEPGQALTYYNKALQLRGANDPAGQASTLNNIGAAYDALGDPQKALDQYDQALGLWRAARDRAGEAATLINVGHIHYLSSAAPAERKERERRRDKALQYFNEALKLWRAQKDRRGEATTLTYIGKVYIASGDPRTALARFNEGLALRRGAGDLRGEAYTRYGMAVAERDRGELLKARAHIEAAIEILDSSRARIVSSELRASYFASIREPYEFYINLLMRLHKQHPADAFGAQALEVSERARARSLLELLIEAGAHIRGDAKPELIEREESVQRQLDAAEKERFESAPGEQRDALVRQIADLLIQQRTIEAQIRTESPRYSGLTQPRPLSLSQIQQLLDDDTLLLEFALGDEASFLWAVSPASIKTYTLPKRSEIEESARRFYELYNPPRDDRRGLRVAPGSNLNKGAEEAAAAALGQMLLGPVAAELASKRLVIVPDGALHFVPFAAVSAPGVERGSTYRPLIADHEIVSLPSFSTLALLREQTRSRAPAPRMLAVLADPVFDKDDERLKGKGAAATSRMRILSQEVEKSAKECGVTGDSPRITRLPGTREEAAKILALVPAAEEKRALDWDASRTTAESDELSQYRFLHFATHGLVNSKHPQLSGIVLSMVDRSGAQQDGFLRAHQVFKLNLPAELVVLSACETGLGAVVRGEGLVSLTRGFMYAGAPRVVVTLWSVADNATAELMVEFYRRMFKEGMRPTAALRAAQIFMRQQQRWQSPYYWAAFVLQGDWEMKQEVQR